MGSLISLRKTKTGDIQVKLEMTQEEYCCLNGKVKNIHLFSEDTAEVDSRFAKRGRCDATKYFLIPKSLRDGLSFEEKVFCQKIDLPKKFIFVFVVDKKTKA